MDQVLARAEPRYLHKATAMGDNVGEVRGTAILDHAIPKMTQIELRAAARNKMDIPLPTTFYVEGTRHVQPVAALRAALERRVMHQKGVQSWKDRVVQVTRAPSTKAHTFWMRDSGFPEMPEFCRLSLETAVRRGGFSVHLWSYEQWDDLPVGVVLCDARAGSTGMI